MKPNNNLVLLIIFMMFSIIHAQDTIKGQETLRPLQKPNASLPENKIDKSKPIKSQYVVKSTINSSDKKIKKINFDGINYFIIDGVWYTRFKNKYVLKQAPKGARLSFIPKGGKMVTMGGVNYYKCKGIFYKKSSSPGIYVVARP
jgi:hypothetical protein